MRRRRAPAASSRARAASRRAQSWNVGQTGNALERQYASWWARARGAGAVLRVAAVAVIGDGRPLVAVVLEGDERTRRGAVRDGQSAFAHPSMIPAADQPLGRARAIGSAASGSRAGARCAAAPRRRSPGRSRRPRTCRRDRRASRARRCCPVDAAELLEHPQLEQARVVLDQPAGVREAAQRRRLAARALERRLALLAGGDDRRRTARFSSPGTMTSRTSTREQLDADPGELAGDPLRRPPARSSPATARTSSAVRPASASRSPSWSAT